MQGVSAVAVASEGAAMMGCYVASTLDGAGFLPPSPMVVRSDCPYQSELYRRSVVARASDLHPVAASDTPPRVWLDEYENIPWELVMNRPHGESECGCFRVRERRVVGAVIASAFCVRKSLIRKAGLAAHVESCRVRSTQRVQSSGDDDVSQVAQRSVGTFIPESHVLDLYRAFHDVGTRRMFGGSVRTAVEAVVEESVGDALATGATWVLKPSMANKGAEIYLVRSFEDVVDAVTSWPEMPVWVLQAYVGPPLLSVGGTKFHLRMYVLVRGSLDVFVYREGLALHASLPHVAPGSSAVGLLEGDNRHSHITNTCVAADREDFDESRVVRLFSELPELLQRDTMPSDVTGEAAVCRIYDGIRESLARLFASLLGDVGGFMPLPNAFELFGVDFLVEGPTLRPLLLEVNAGPDLKQTGGRLKHLIASMLDDVIDTAVLGLTGVERRVRTGLEWASFPRGARATAGWVWDGVALALPDERRGCLPGSPGGVALGLDNAWDRVLGLDTGMGLTNITVHE
jgi:tubulin---tyrosine ligase